MSSLLGLLMEDVAVDVNQTPHNLYGSQFIHFLCDNMIRRKRWFTTSMAFEEYLTTRCEIQFICLQVDSYVTQGNFVPAVCSVGGGKPC
jgi:hypothetical protein